MLKKALVASLGIIFLTVTCQAQSAPEPDVSVDPESIQVIPKEAGFSAIQGIARNTSGKKLSSASVQFSVYDASDVKVTDATDITGVLDAGESWRFEAMVTVPKEQFGSYKLQDTNGIHAR